MSVTVAFSTSSSTTVPPSAALTFLASPCGEVVPVVPHRGLLGVADVVDHAVADEHRPVAERLDRAHVVGDQQDRRALPAPLVKDVHALLGERDVTDRQHLVHQHDVRVRLDHDGERQAHHHPGRVVLELEVHELAQLGEVEDGVEPLARLALGEAEQHPVDHAVLARAQLGVEAHAELDERGQPARHPNRPLVRPVDAGEDLEQAALAGAVLSDDPEELALVNVERDVLQGA